MDENEINRRLKNVSGYLGTFAVNELDNLYINHYPSYIVINLDNRESDGTHWIAVAMYLNDVYICDSLGALLPSSAFPTGLINFLYRICFRRTLFITQQLQSSMSESCGLYCILFVFTLSKQTFSSFLSKFSTNLELNDLIVALYTKTGK